MLDEARAPYSWPPPQRLVVLEALQTLLAVLNAKILAIQEKQRYLEELKVKRRQRHDEIASSIIQVNMRGTIFEIEKDIFTRVDGSYFDVMLSMDETMIVDESEASVPVYFVDRCYEGFERIISNGITLVGLNQYEMVIVHNNLAYFRIYEFHQVRLLESGVNMPIRGGDLLSVILLRDGRICTGFSDENISLFYVGCPLDYQLRLPDHGGRVRLVQMPDGRLCSTSKPANIKIWNSSTGQ